MSRSVLLIDDKLSDYTVILDALNAEQGPPFTLDWATSLSDGLEKLSTSRTTPTTAPNRIAAIIVDLFLPDSKGIETFDLLLQAAPHTPILVITPLQDE